MIQLRDYQKTAVQKVIEYFKKFHDPSLIVLPTGAGKSVVIAELAKIAKGRVLVLAHVKELVEQNFQKYTSLKLEAGIFSAGLKKKDSDFKCLFGSVQSVHNAEDQFFKNFSILIIDECHRVAEESSSQYQEIITKLKINNPNLCILGLTATPYRLGVGWIYNYHFLGEVKTEKERFFKYCIYELPISYMIQNKFLTKPVKINIPVTCYDFSDLKLQNNHYSNQQIEQILKNQNRLTPLIVKNIIDITEQFNRKGVMIFACNVKHAIEILSGLPKDQVRLVVADTSLSQREEIISDFKNMKFKYLVNVSVLTTGFDAPHVDVIAILRPTESNSLYQQIVGRGLRLFKNKEDCLILDYTGMGHDIFNPTIHDKKPNPDVVTVQVSCPACGFINDFWGYKNESGEIEEHFGRNCKGVQFDYNSGEQNKCNYLFRFKICPQCQCQNEITARLCQSCKLELIDVDTKLKTARLSKFSHLMHVEGMDLTSKKDKNGKKYLEVKYYDSDGENLYENYFFNNSHSIKKFEINFARFHLKIPGNYLEIRPLEVENIIQKKNIFRNPKYVIARKNEKFWLITEKIFLEEIY